jgi:hypothetical protein
MKKLLALVLLIASMPAVSLRGQEPTPSSQKCSTDARRWSAEDVDSLSHRELRNRAIEMLTCDVAYGKAWGAYEGLGFKYSTALYKRMSHFLFERHPEMGKKYLQEDAAGLR